MGHVARVESSYSKCIAFTSNVCLLHKLPSSRFCVPSMWPERPERLKIMHKIAHTLFQPEYVVQISFDECIKSDFKEEIDESLAIVHSGNYLDELDTFVNNPVLFSRDVYVTKQSRQALCAAAAVICHAVNFVMRDNAPSSLKMEGCNSFSSFNSLGGSESARVQQSKGCLEENQEQSRHLGIVRAACLVRPPGHHAIQHHPFGFCLVNNVAIGVAHAILHYPSSKIAIVDFDLHFGNGTAEFVERINLHGICNSEPNEINSKMNANRDVQIMLISFHDERLFPFEELDSESDQGSTESDGQFTYPRNAYTPIPQNPNLINTEWLMNDWSLVYNAKVSECLLPVFSCDETTGNLDADSGPFFSCNSFPNLNRSDSTLVSSHVSIDRDLCLEVSEKAIDNALFRIYPLLDSHNDLTYPVCLNSTNGESFDSINGNKANKGTTENIISNFESEYSKEYHDSSPFHLKSHSVEKEGNNFNCNNDVNDVKTNRRAPVRKCRTGQHKEEDENSTAEPHRWCGVYNLPLKEFRHKVMLACALLRAFCPEILFISAGFDAHVNESRRWVNCPEESQLTDQDYSFVTQQLIRVANEYCSGRIVSVTEGGYHELALQGGLRAHLEAMKSE